LYLCIGIFNALIHEILSHFRWHKYPRLGQCMARAHFTTRA
jgi:hypothetical protein